jgi:hypothetical protein
MSLLRHPAPAAKFVGLANPIGYAAQCCTSAVLDNLQRVVIHRHRAEPGFPVSAAT